MTEGQWISLFAMFVSLTAMLIQLVFGVLGMRRAQMETDRQIAETKKQEKLHILSAEENYKTDVRMWGRSVVREMALAQQLCKIDPSSFVTSDYDLKRAETVAKLRGYLDKAKWLFPNLATPSAPTDTWEHDPKKRLSALEAILHAYHVLDTVKPKDQKNRDRSVVNLRNLRKQFVREMRRAVDPHVRGEDIERLMAEVDEAHEADKQKQIEESKPAEVMSAAQSNVYRK
ncbi:MAG: hypothetical protein COA43_12540 [Robiginitomaculum sp.]|nr:MAG: hypothetical protein COA43_12540 [Robiginitomaculum sp.]